MTILPGSQPKRPSPDIRPLPPSPRIVFSQVIHYLLDLLLEALALFMAKLCLSSRSVTQIQNQLMTSTKANAKKTLFLSPSPPQVLAE